MDFSALDVRVIPLNKIPQPHDHFMKELLSHPGRAGTLLRERLPEEVARFLSAKPPEPVPGSFVDEQLKEHRSDQLFQVETISGRTAFLYVLIEHKSSPDEQIGLHLLRYMAEILRDWEKKNPNWKRLPAIIPFVVYHGAEEWKIPTEFRQIIDAEEAWGPYLMNFRFPVVDLGEIPDGLLSGDPRLHVWLLAMKYATREKRQMAVRELLIRALRAVPEDLRPIVAYLIQTYVYDEKTLRRMIRSVKPEEEEMISQFARDVIAREKPKWERQFREEMASRFAQDIVAREKPKWEQMFRQEGRLEGEAELLLRQLSRRFPPLPDEISERVHNADPGTIESWADRILDAKSLDEVFQE